jgi:phosphohistidine phosphatase
MADEVTHRLILLRHAKSDWPENVPDHDRPLAKRGRRDAPNVGRWLRQHGHVPDVVICSTATRTRQTWELVCAKLHGHTPAVTFEPRAYAASAMNLLYLAREQQESTGTALIIAHNPGTSELASSLAGTSRDELNFPTAGVAVLEIRRHWADLGPGDARLVAFVTPADM